MSSQRTKLALAFGAVALGGVALGFAISARLSFTGTAQARAPGSLAQPASLPPPTPVTPFDVPATPPPLNLPPPQPPVATTGPAAASFAGLVKQVGPAVVHVGIENQRGQQLGLGTGFIISPDGYILTNEHVVGKAPKIIVRLPDGRELEAKVIGVDAPTDLAVVKIEDSQPLPYLTFGDSDALEVGDWVIALGSPLGLEHTVTAGIVSAKGRKNINPSGRRSSYEDFIQTDAAINQGNSGGPLINIRGEVIGINSAVSTQGQGIGFAIPSNMAKTLLPQLQQTGQVQRSWLGVSITPVSPQAADTYRLPDSHGALINNVEPGSPAAKAGLIRGEIIRLFDGKPIEQSSDLPWIVSNTGIGKTVTVQVVGPSGTRDVTVVLERMP